MSVQIIALQPKCQASRIKICTAPDYSLICLEAAQASRRFLHRKLASGSFISQSTVCRHAKNSGIFDSGKGTAMKEYKAGSPNGRWLINAAALSARRPGEAQSGQSFGLRHQGRWPRTPPVAQFFESNADGSKSLTSHTLDNTND
jgi:hypothetical protein